MKLSLVIKQLQAIQANTKNDPDVYIEPAMDIEPIASVKLEEYHVIDPDTQEDVTENIVIVGAI